MRKNVLTLTILAVAAAAVLANSPIIPTPPWRGLEGTTFEEWQFGTATNPAAPDVVNNPYGTPSAAIQLGDLAKGWVDASQSAFGNRQGFWDLGSGGTISLTIPNRPVPLEYKEIWVAVTYFADIPRPPVVSVPNGTAYGGPIAPILLEAMPTGAEWYAEVTMWRIYPNPDQETILITADGQFGSMIDTVTVDTYCVPEPATLALLALGGLGLIIRRKRS